MPSADIRIADVRRTSVEDRTAHSEQLDWSEKIRGRQLIRELDGGMLFGFLAIIFRALDLAKRSSLGIFQQ